MAECMIFSAVDLLCGLSSMPLRVGAELHGKELLHSRTIQ